MHVIRRRVKKPKVIHTANSQDLGTNLASGLQQTQMGPAPTHLQNWCLTLSPFPPIASAVQIASPPQKKKAVSLMQPLNINTQAQGEKLHVGISTVS